MRRILPHPYLSAMLFVIWLLLVNSVKTGSLVMAAILAILIPLLTAPYWPDRPRIRNWPAAVAYVALVFWDIVVANVQVARMIVFWPVSRFRPAWFTVPLDLTSPEAITVLAGTITMTPGTLTADIAADGRSLLIHTLHTDDADATRDGIKSRYETRLKRIFE